MLQQFHSELGGKAKFESTARYNPFIKKWAVRTKSELKGRGISFYEKSEANPKINIYYMTEKAFNEYCKSNNVSQEILFN